jgi:hypothetical protein
MFCSSMQLSGTQSDVATGCWECVVFVSFREPNRFPLRTHKTLCERTPDIPVETPACRDWMLECFGPVSVSFCLVRCLALGHGFETDGADVRGSDLRRSAWIRLIRGFETDDRDVSSPGPTRRNGRAGNRFAMPNVNGCLSCDASRDPGVSRLDA